MDTSFNEKTSTFNLLGENGIVEARGKFARELVEADYDKVGSINLDDFRLKDLTEIATKFPNIASLRIRKADFLKSLNGINKLKNLKDLVIDSTTLSDLSNIESLEKLAYLNIEDCPEASRALDALPPSLTGLIINANYTALDKLSGLTSLTNLNIIGIGSDLECLPDFPQSIKKLSLRGFPNFKDGSCFKNLHASVYLNNLLDNSIENLPEGLSESRWFKPS